jgi:putative transposase
VGLLNAAGRRAYEQLRIKCTEVRFGSEWSLPSIVGTSRYGALVPARTFEPRPGFVLQAYRFALDPTPRQARALASHAGAARFAYNWAVRRILANWAQRTAEESYGIAEEDRTPWHDSSAWGLRKEWNQVKGSVAPWWAENSKEAYAFGLACAAEAFGNYAAWKNGSRKGPRMGCPRIKGKRRAAKSCRFTTGPIRVWADRCQVTLPRLGAIKTHESTRKLQRRLADGRARILSATVRQESGGRWFVFFQAEVERRPGRPSRPYAVAGVDLGVKHLAVVADSLGEVRYIPNPCHLGEALGRLRRVSRRMSRRRGPVRHDPATGQTTRRQPSQGWEESARALGRAHARVRQLRADGLHKLTSALAAQYGQVVIEDLNVAGMMRRKRRLGASPTPASARSAAS